MNEFTNYRDSAVSGFSSSLRSIQKFHFCLLSSVGSKAVLDGGVVNSRVHAVKQLRLGICFALLTWLPSTFMIVDGVCEFEVLTSGSC